MSRIPLSPRLPLLPRPPPLARFSYYPCRNLPRARSPTATAARPRLPCPFAATDEWEGQAEHWVYVAVAVGAVTILMLVAGEASPRPPSPPRFCPPPLPCFRYASSAMDAWVCQAEAWAGRVEHWICQQTREQIYLAVAVIAVTALVLVAASRPKSSKPNTIVLSGLSGSGKTVLFYQLRDGSSHQETVTLMEHNNDTFVLHSELERQGKIKPIHVIDVPGHARLKPKLDEVLPQAAGVVFVVDAQDFLSSVQAAAEYLYDILTTVLKKRVPVLIFCNKADEVTAHSKEFIKKQLEKEVNKLRESRNAISSATDITDEVQLGVPGEAFNFSQCPNKVIVAEGAGLTGNVSAVEQ